MSNLFRFGEMVHVPQRTRAGVPEEFLWRGRRHRVRQVEGCRDELRRSQDPMSRQRLFFIRTSAGLRCVLSHDEGQDIWRLERMLTSKD